MPQIEQSAQGKVLREIIARVHADNRIGRRIKSGEMRKNMAEAEPEWKVPAGYTLSVIRQPKFDMELLQPAIPSEKFIILQLHGGAYVGKLINIYRSFAGLYSELGRGGSVLTPDFRVAPEDPYPAAFEDVITSYRWLLSQGWAESQIIVAVDSAGGGLAMALCMYLKNHGQPLPAGIIAMSPWTDLTLSGRSIRKNYHKDPVFGNTKDSLVFNRDYVKGADASNPYISPLFGDFSGFPPMLIQVGGDEMILSDSTRVKKRQSVPESGCV